MKKVLQILFLCSALKAFESLNFSVSIHTRIIFIDNIAPDKKTSKDQIC